MNTRDTVSDSVAKFLQLAIDGDGSACTRLTIDLLDDGVPSAVVIGLLAAVQREVGERWLRGNLTVADEHLVSISTQKALDALANTAEPPVPVGLIVVACAEGDWHSLPAQMFAELLRSRGFNALFLGASVPADHVAALLSRRRADALAVNCNLPLFYSGITRLADAAHHLGIPVIAGGRALGRDPSRALRLGADAWAPDLDQADTILRGWQRNRPRVARDETHLDAAAAELDADADRIADQAFGILVNSHPAMTCYDARQLARAKEDLAFIARFATAALVVDDASVFSAFVEWLQTVLAHRAVPPAALHAGITALAPILSRQDPRAGKLAADALLSLTGG